ncbi:MAG TPA: D-2-hydroxyacid dehydrogenase [Verrucomicrobiota bacterium]|nr:D-2-hydroxyacid dehydrogenase [Verrucomicrobiota bacterium]HNU50763.1 D-2-hydroxyacid dehydrogenase [Verrucomicrobiota bacterium]
MRIVVLDGHTLNPGDVSWDGLQALGDCVVYDRTPPAQVVARAREAEIVFTNKTVLDAVTLRALPMLRYIGVLATGYNVVDVRAARERNVLVTNIPTYGTRSVAQHVFALLLELTQHVGHHADTVRDGRWSTSPDFCYWDHPLIELEGLTMGIVGFGRIGQAVATLALAFGMKVLAYDLQPPPVLPPGVRLADLDAVFAQSDVISLHCPLTAENQGLLNARRLGTMKRSAFLINTSRGPLINEADLAAALNAGRIAGAGLDVLAVEPPRADNRLLTAKNCLITPHIAWATHSARLRLMQIAVENLRAFLAGQPVNVVN